MATNTKQKQPADLGNVIATIDVNLTTNFCDPSPRERFLDEYNQCPLCGTDLLFTHVTNFVENVAHEEAHCEACKVRTKNAQHSLQ
jgi:hypothetical protein